MRGYASICNLQATSPCPDIVSSLVLACKHCNLSKSDKDTFYWYGLERMEEIPKLVLSKYLKLVYDFHEQNGTLNDSDLNADGKLDVIDLAIFNTPKKA